jgi:carbon monoxide dehydrogenase subunit G
MKLEQSFEVAASLEQVWDALVDIERVAPCLPGATVTGRNDDGSYNGTFTVKIGPTSASYNGTLKMEELDEVAHTATMHAEGTDKRGQGGAKATIFSTLAPADGSGTRVEVITDYHITGRLARFGRGGMIEDVSERVLRDFARCLQARLAGDGESAADAGEDSSRQPEDAGRPSEDAARRLEDAPLQPADAARQREGSARPPEDAARQGEGSARPPEEAGRRREVAPQPGQEPIEAISMTASVLWARARRNPAPLIALIVGFVVGLAARRRATR